MGVKGKPSDLPSVSRMAALIRDHGWTVDTIVATYDVTPATVRRHFTDAGFSADTGESVTPTRPPSLLVLSSSGSGQYVAGGDNAAAVPTEPVRYRSSRRHTGLDWNKIREEYIANDGVVTVTIPRATAAPATPATQPNHLYVKLPMRWEKFARLLLALAEAGVIETGYAEASIEREATTLRLPWVKKKDGEEFHQCADLDPHPKHLWQASGPAVKSECAGVKTQVL